MRWVLTSGSSTSALTMRWPCRRMLHAVAQARERGFIGDDIMASGFDFDVRLVQGGGAFVCGEETALL